jgi:hypothetical protein
MPDHFTCQGESAGAQWVNINLYILAWHIFLYCKEDAWGRCIYRYSTVLAVVDTSQNIGGGTGFRLRLSLYYRHFSAGKFSSFNWQCTLIDDSYSIDPYSIALLCLMPDDFTRQGETAATQWVN